MGISFEGARAGQARIKQGFSYHAGVCAHEFCAHFLRQHRHSGVPRDGRVPDPYCRGDDHARICGQTPGICARHGCLFGQGSLLAPGRRISLPGLPHQSDDALSSLREVESGRRHSEIPHCHDASRRQHAAVEARIARRSNDQRRGCNSRPGHALGKRRRVGNGCLYRRHRG